FADSRAGQLIAGFLTTDPDEKKLSDLVQQYPIIGDVTDFLRSDANDTKSLARIKGAVELLAVGEIIGGTPEAAKLLYKSSKATAQMVGGWLKKIKGTRLGDQAMVDSGINEIWTGLADREGLTFGNPNAEVEPLIPSVNDGVIPKDEFLRMGATTRE